MDLLDVYKRRLCQTGDPLSHGDKCGSGSPALSTNLIIIFVYAVVGKGSGKPERGTVAVHMG